MRGLQERRVVTALTGERTAVIADVHLGYEWARGSAGDCVPAHSLDETLARLERLLDRAPIARLVVAGDLVESPRPCRRTAADLRRPPFPDGSLKQKLLYHQQAEPTAVAQLRSDTPPAVVALLDRLLAKRPEWCSGSK